MGWEHQGFQGHGETKQLTFGFGAASQKIQSGIWDFEFSAVGSTRQEKYIVITVGMRPEVIIANRNTINTS